MNDFLNRPVREGQTVHLWDDFACDLGLATDKGRVTLVCPDCIWADFGGKLVKLDGAPATILTIV